MKKYKRDSKGRFTKEKEENERTSLDLGGPNGFVFTLRVPGIKTIIYYMTILIILWPWISILLRKNILQKTLNIMDSWLIPSANETKKENEGDKKKGLFNSFK